jgi:hypothetical protein
VLPPVPVEPLPPSPPDWLPVFAHEEATSMAMAMRTSLAFADMRVSFGDPIRQDTGVTKKWGYRRARGRLHFDSRKAPV